MRKVLFVVEKWFDAAHPERGLATNEYGTIGTLASLDLGVPLMFYHDVFFQDNPEAGEKEIDNALAGECEQLRPDMALATVILQRGDRNITPNVCGYIRDELKIPVVIIWAESAPDVVRWADKYAPSVTANIFLDTKDEWRKHAKHPERCVHLLEPRNTALFNAPANAVRDIPLSFVGSTFRRMDRAMNLSILWGSGVRYWHFGGVDGATPFLSSITDYVRVLQRSLVTINFTSATTFRHINGRVCEATLCGAMLLQSEDDETSAILDTNQEYVPFKEHFSLNGSNMEYHPEGDLLAKAIRYAYKEQDEARKIAAAGNVKAMQLFDGKNFWTSIFDLAGLA